MFSAVNLSSDVDFDTYCRKVLSRENLSYEPSHWLELRQLLDEYDVQTIRSFLIDREDCCEGIFT